MLGGGIDMQFVLKIPDTVKNKLEATMFLLGKFNMDFIFLCHFDLAKCNEILLGIYSHICYVNIYTKYIIICNYYFNYISTDHF